jgi:uncharacterized repeat protein (TIGR02543 family)
MSTLEGEVVKPQNENGDGALVLKIYYDADTVVVSYDLNNGIGSTGVDYGDETIKYGTATTTKTAPRRTGYTFIGWSDGTTTYQADETITPLADTKLVAQWKTNGGSGGGGSSTRYYTLTYVSSGGTQYGSERHASGKEVTITKAPVRDGYTFTGWYSDAALTDKITSVKMTTSKSVYAGWEEISGTTLNEEENKETSTENDNTPKDDNTNTSSSHRNGYYVPEKLNGDDHFAYVFGYPDDTVHPSADITRAEVATIFFRLLKSEVRKANWTETSGFDDVNGEWYTTAISTMEKIGIVEGRDNNLFEPNAPITRAEFAAICARFDDDAEIGDITFTDIANHWAESEIRAAANRGWVNGYEDNSFRPNQNITRSEAMALINRVLERLPESEQDLLANDMVTWPDNADTSAWYYLDVQEATNEHDFTRKADEIHETWTLIKDRSLLGL